MTGFYELVYPELDKKQLTGYITISTISGIVGICLTYLVGHFLDLIIASQQEMEWVEYICAYVGLNIINRICCIQMEYQRVSIEGKLSYAMTRKMLKIVYNTSYLNYCNENPAAISQKINNDTGIIASFYVSFFKNIIVQTVSTIVYLFVLIKNSLLIGYLVILMMIAYIGVYLIVKKLIYRTEKEVIEQKTNYATTLFVLIEKSVSIRMNGMSQYHFGRMENDYQNLLHALKKQIGAYSIYNVLKDLLILIFQTALFIAGGRMIQMGGMSVGTLVVMLNYFVYALGCMEFFLNIGSSYQTVKASEERLKKYLVLDELPTGKEKQKIIEKIELKNLEFAYPGENRLLDITTEFHMGKIYWIRGRNGVGKSSLINIMLGIYGNSYMGQVIYNGYRLDELDYKWFINNNTAVIEQDPYIFDGTIQENICLKGNQIDMDELKKLVSQMKLDSLMKSADMGSTKHRENKIYSGGEKQKIAIVRTLLSNSCIWILDEPTANLDEESKMIFYKELEQRKKEHIILLISHETPLCRWDHIVDIGR